MDEPSQPRARIRAGVGAVVVLLLVGLGCAVLVAALSPRGVVAELDAADSAPTAVATGPIILVHVLGAVADPGLYELREGDRVVDAVAAAGGLVDGAEPAAINLARALSDGEQLVVPLQGEVPAASAPVSDGRVNLNTADAAALETLPRVGPALAARILQWREAHGRFAAIEDLMQVTGIGEKTFDGLRDLVTI